jgi:DNA repair exonuclease SbcCD nuclease subunit
MSTITVVKLPHPRCTFTFITDLHMSAVPPGRRGDDYQKAILDKVRFVRELTQRIKAVGLCGGDVFHSKNPRAASNTLGLLVEAAKEFREFPYGCLWGAVGNHDLSADRLDSLTKQPLGLLIAAGVYRDLTYNPVIFSNNSGTVQVLVETFPYAHEGVLESIMAAAPRPAGVTHRVGIVHAYGQPGNEGSLFGERIIGYNEVAESDYDFLLWGHDHSRKETVTVGRPTHIHLGSLARAAFDTDQTDRPVACAIISFAEDGIRYKEKEIPVTPLQVAFQTADKGMDSVAKSEELKQFLTGLEEQVDDIEATDPREILKTLCPVDEPELLSFVKELCEL